MPTRRKPAGVTLLELLIAMGVIAVGMSGVAASLIFGVTKSNYGSNMAVGTHHARTLMETTLGRTLVSSDAYTDSATGLPRTDSGLNDTEAQAPRPLNDPPFNDPSIHQTIPPEELGLYTRKIQMARRGAKGTVGEFLVTMTVTIFWEDKGVQKSVTTSSVVPTTKAIP
jgi:prepilin-type N-terminal cleavage/methylation domain-containing protein